MSSTDIKSWLEFVCQPKNETPKIIAIVLFCSAPFFHFVSDFISFHFIIIYHTKMKGIHTQHTHTQCLQMGVGSVALTSHGELFTTQSYRLQSIFFAIQNFAHKLIACYKNFNLKFNFRHTVYWALSFVFLQSFFFFLAFHTLYFIWHAAVTERMCVYGIWLIYLNLFETVNEITVFAGVLYQSGLFYTQTFNCMLGYMGIFPYSWAAQQ